MMRTIAWPVILTCSQDRDRNDLNSLPQWKLRRLEGSYHTVNKIPRTCSECPLSEANWGTLASAAKVCNPPFVLFAASAISTPYTA